MGMLSGMHAFNPKRRWFQFSLLTRLIVITLFPCTLVGLYWLVTLPTRLSTEDQLAHYIGKHVTFTGKFEKMQGGKEYIHFGSEAIYLDDFLDEKSGTPPNGTIISVMGELEGCAPFGQYPREGGNRYALYRASWESQD
jgi:hypothetical protein